MARKRKATRKWRQESQRHAAGRAGTCEAHPAAASRSPEGIRKEALGVQVAHAMPLWKGTDMDSRHRQLLRESGGDDADARGEHVYPDDELPRNGSAVAAHEPVQRKGYMAGADGTQEVPATSPVDETAGRPLIPRR